MLAFLFVLFASYTVLALWPRGGEAAYAARIAGACQLAAARAEEARARLDVNLAVAARTAELERSCAAAQAQAEEDRWLFPFRAWWRRNGGAPVAAGGLAGLGAAAAAPATIADFEAYVASLAATSPEAYDALTAWLDWQDTGGGPVPLLERVAARV